MGEEDTNPLNIPRLAILMIGFASAAAVVLIYHCFAIGWCNRWRSFRDHQQGQGLPSRQEETLSSLEHSTIQLIPAHKYRKKAGPIGEDSGTCAVCLSEFEEGEELRTLPSCKHSFHVPCIDMWLYSHSNCPLCRAETMPDHGCSPELQYLRMLQEFGGQSR